MCTVVRDLHGALLSALSEAPQQARARVPMASLRPLEKARGRIWWLRRARPSGKPIPLPSRQLVTSLSGFCTAEAEDA